VTVPKIELRQQPVGVGIGIGVATAVGDRD